MKIEINVPKVSIEEKSGILVHWYKNNGEEVKEKEEIAEVMVEKITLTIKSPASGKLSIIVDENEEIIQGQLIGTVET
ncbi:MAG: dihydrolipoyllysine succinyltransferase [Nitrospiraceae bacterium]|nr:dihydrolipoyllysine succinyltransferase [Nitrospiraceae bacterium]